MQLTVLFFETKKQKTDQTHGKPRKNNVRLLGSHSKSINCTYATKHFRESEHKHFIFATLSFLNATSQHGCSAFLEFKTNQSACSHFPVMMWALQTLLEVLIN